MIRRDVCKKCVWMRNLAGTVYCPLPKCIYNRKRDKWRRNAGKEVLDEKKFEREMVKFAPAQ
jgi:hypothetical protein